MTTTRTPVVFIHGLWLHATSWAPWVELFREAGYEPVAPGWPGDPDTVEAARANPDSIADHGIDDVTKHYEKIIDALPARPVLIGHSFGGMIAEKLLGEDYGAAAIAIDAAQIKGVLPLPLSALHSTLPVFKNPANKHTPDPGELARLAGLVDDGRLRTVVSQTFPLRDGRRGYESGSRPRPPGKTVLIVR